MIVKHALLYFQYWSGYYTTRPFYKHLDRILEGNFLNFSPIANVSNNLLLANLRSAEIIYSMTWSHQHRLAAVPDALKEWMTKMMRLLNKARHNLGLFQHHDGITGTAKDHVVQDYAKKYQFLRVDFITGLSSAH